MKVTLGKDGLEHSYQAKFPEITECCRCNGEARIGFVMQESAGEAPYVCELHPNKGKGGYWLHDCCAVAVYLCRECLKATALVNQS